MLQKIKNSNFVQDFLKYRYLLSEIIRRNIKVQYRDSVLGIFWTFLQPLLSTLVLVAVFSNIFHNRTEYYPIYVLCGRLLYDFYSQATKRGMRSITTAAGVIKKVYVPKYIYPLGNTLSCFVTFLISLLVLVAFMIYFIIFKGMSLTPYVLLAIVPVLILYILSFGVGMILATMSVFFKDIEYLYEVFCMLLFYMTPVFYSVETLNISNSFIKMGLMANPLYSIVNLFRFCIIGTGTWNWGWFFYSFGFAIVTVIIGGLLFRAKEDKFILHI
ncbi:MAG: ABC transporter permease [Clostridia bacterium]|nr:ABC transporter permease [Clostridia bacterium]